MDLQRLIDNKEIEHLFQPIWDINKWRVYGYEALLRIPSLTKINIENIFGEARKQEILYELDTLSIETTVKHFPIYILENQFFFINVFPSTLIDNRFESFLRHLVMEYPYIQGRLVFELIETIIEERIWSIPLLKTIIKKLKEHNVLVALGDIGNGTGTLQKIIEFSPNIVKLDRYFSHNLSFSLEKQKELSNIIDYCGDNIGIVIEGIEKETDLAIAKILKFQFAQGYLIGKPERMDMFDIIRNTGSTHDLIKYILK